MKKLLYLFIFLSFFKISLPNDSIPCFSLITEEFPPFNYTENEKAAGIAIDILDEMFKRIGSNQSSFDAKFYPWARGFYIAQNQKKSIIFTTARTKEREQLFKWVGPIFSDKTEAFCLNKNNIKINSISDFSNYTISSYIGDSQEELIKELGIPLEKLDRLTNSEARFKKVYSGRSDIVFVSRFAFLDYLKKENIEFNIFKSIYQLDSIDLCYAFSLDTPDFIIDKFQEIINELHKENFIRDTFDKYGIVEAYYIEK